MLKKSAMMHYKCLFYIKHQPQSKPYKFSLKKILLNRLLA